MARFYGVIGYADQVETKPGVWEDVITERNYRGDVTRISRKMQESMDKVNSDLTISNMFSIVADAYAYEHFFKIRYIMWSGVRWTVSDVEVQRPRLNLRIGGEYNGDTP